MKSLWQALGSRLGFGRERRDRLLGQHIKDAKGTEFFRWFSFAETGAAKDESGNTVISFRPEGEKFHYLVELSVVVEKKDRIAALSLSLARSFLEHDKDGVFARDIAKSFLRSTLPERSVAILADEIEWRHNFPVLTHTSTDRPQLPPQPTAGFLAFMGRQQLYEESCSRSSLRIEQTRDEDGEAVVITVRASR